MTSEGESSDKAVPVGRRVFLGMAGLGALGVLFGTKLQGALGAAIGTGLGGLLPGGNRFRIYLSRAPSQPFSLETTAYQSQVW